jgi:hypothetical protein
MLFVSTILCASDDGYIMVSRSNSSNALTFSAGTEEISYKDFQDVDEERKKYEYAQVKGDKNSLNIIKNLGNVANACAVPPVLYPLVTGISLGIAPVAITAVGSTVGVASLAVSYINERNNKRMKNEIEAAQKARDSLYAQFIDKEGELSRLFEEF